MPKYVEVAPALDWRFRQLSQDSNSEELAEALSIEGLPYEQIPEKLWKSVRAFRHLRQDAIKAAARRYLRGK